MTDGKRRRALLVLEDGRAFRGRAWGAEGERCGEMVFNTSMSGYQEVLTDPSYAGQVVCMTYPLIGNYGVNRADEESARPWVEGFVVREASRTASNWRAEETLDAYLKRWGVVAIDHVDTRALVRHIRDKGAMRACISSIDRDEKSLTEKARASAPMENRELASAVTTERPYEVPARGGERFRVVCYDFGVKRNSLNELAALGCRVTVVPASTPASEVLAMGPDGVYLSNGPGDPASMTDVATGRVEITSHNHGFAVRAESLPADVEVTHVNLNDGCVEGMRHKSLPVISVQYHPEAAPGPHDAEHHFRRFVELMERERAV